MGVEVCGEGKGGGGPRAERLRGSYIFKWERVYARGGVDAPKRRKAPGGPACKKRAAKSKLVPELVEKDLF
jgi:hypothetical protein